MDPKSLQLLELDKVLARLETYAAFSASKQLARELAPTSDAVEARQRQRATSEARRLLTVRPEITVGGAHDVRMAADRAARGAVLEPEELLDLRSTLVAARTLARLFDRLTEPLPVLSSLAAGLDVPPGLIEAISRVLDDRGEVLDSASEKLADIRHSLRGAHDRLRSKLDRLVHDPKTAPMLQEPIVTQRDGRFVVPLRAEFKGRLKAVIHDQSASGATLFVEPLAVVDLNNQVRELELAERDEIRRILTDLSTEVGGGAEAIRRTVGALADLDLALAKARYAEDLRAEEPELLAIPSGTLSAVEPAPGRPHPGSTLRLRDARHPLLDPAAAVPVELVLDPETFVLVITGPNTGGKTVALKTAGLLALMAQCGLHLPTAPDSAISVFEAIFADIGDEQSIEQSLSTFSGHIAAIVRILDSAGPRSLVLLDELGAGTDPEEGAALARAILGSLIDLRVTTLVATHYPELKTFAHATPGARNASVEFDLASLRPTYHLSIGLPGRSNALAIASRLGLQREVIERARQMVAPEALRAEGLLDEIHRQREEARQARREAEAVRLQAEAQRAELRRRLEAIEVERAEILDGARQEAAEEAQAVYVEAEELRRKLARAALPLSEIETAAGDAEDLADRTAEPIRPALLEPEAPLRVGDRVFLRSLGSEGVLTAMGEAEAEVQVGRLRVRASPGDLTSPRASEPVRSQSARPSPLRVREASLPMEIDLRGLPVDDALDSLERHLDSAYLAGMPFVRVIHGKGTGRLRQAVRRALRENPYAAGFDAGKDGEGGEGVTVVRLAAE
ncbi:MAG TPA: endonuclease MutS2 [Anaerolineales bacterium]|nr:endonuclease MutS2 [Anaerolineales bacterium]